MTEWIYDPRAGRCRKTDAGQAVSDKIEEIRARHLYDDNWRDSQTMRFETWDPQTHDDRAWLLAEVERHRAEIERLRAEIARMKKLHTPPAGIPWPAREEDKP